jgi:chromosome transmission fidelity protein 1
MPSARVSGAELGRYYERRVAEARAAGPIGQLDDDGLEGGEGSASVVQPLHQFLTCLTDLEEEGRVAVYRDEATGRLRLSYQLLNASSHFADIVRDAHAVVLAGGTMQPMAEYVQHLMPDLPPSRIRVLSCSHVVPQENVLPITLAAGPSGVPFDFRHQQRSSKAIKVCHANCYCPCQQRQLA